MRLVLNTSWRVHSGKARSRRGARISLLILAIVCSVAIACFILWTITEKRCKTHELIGRGRLGRIALALHNYYEDHGTYPPLSIRDEHGNLMHSWRVLILPYLEQGDFYTAYDLSQPWDSPRNLALASRAPKFIKDSFRSPRDPSRDENWTSFVAIDYSRGSLAEPATLLAAGKAKSSRIMLVEVHESNIHWMEPRDISIDQALSGLTPLSGGKTCNFLTADGKVGTLSENSILFQNSEADLLRLWLLSNGRLGTSEKGKLE